MAAAPTAVDGLMGMFVGIVTATARTLRATVPEPVRTARVIGHAWADQMVGADQPDRADPDIPACVDIGEHLDEVASFFTTLGFAASVAEGRRGIRLGSCPFLRDGVVDPLVCEMHRGMTRRVVEVTSRGRAEAELRPWVSADACAVTLVERGEGGSSPSAGPHRHPLSYSEAHDRGGSAGTQAERIGSGGRRGCR